MRLSLGIFLTCVVVVAIAGYAIGAGSKSSDVTLCAAKSDGSLSLGAKGKCAKGQKKLTIAKEGPAGPVGAAGPPGAKGDPGSPGDPGAPATVTSSTLEAVHYVTEPATGECATKAATFCEGATPPGWSNFGNGYEKAGFYRDSNGLVHLVGAVYFTTSGGAGSGVEATGPFYLPPGFRPATAEVFDIAVGNGGFSNAPGTTTVEVKPSGEVAIGKVTNRAYALNGIIFRAG